MLDAARRAVRVIPYPGAIDPSGPWVHHDAGPMGEGSRVSLGTREEWTPTDPTQEARAIRAHEMLHVRYSPRRWQLRGLHPMSLQAAEDCRINVACAAEAGLDAMLRTHLGAQHLPDLRAKALTLPLVDAARLAVASLGTAVEEPIVHDLHEVATSTDATPAQRERAEVLANIMWRARGMVRQRNAFRTTRALARMLDTLADPTPPPPPPPGRGRPSGPEDGLDRMRARVADSGRPRVAPPVPADGRPGRWGRLTILRPVLPRLCPMLRLARRWRPSDIGATPRYMHRLTSPLSTGPAIFGELRRVPGGTVLLDWSGSMHLDSTDVEAMIQAAPAATVAVYGGDYSTGTLTVIARRGRLVQRLDDHRPGGGNVVDGPALDWLAEQEEPRLWVSDGVVTGVGDAVSSAITRDALRIAIAGRIRRVDSPDEARAGLLGSRATTG